MQCDLLTAFVLEVAQYVSLLTDADLKLCVAAITTAIGLGLLQTVK